MSPSPRLPTNTLILTNVVPAVLADPSDLITFLAHDNDFIIELVSLPKFGRILIICESEIVAKQVFGLLRQSNTWSLLKISYSIRDNNFSIMENNYLNQEGKNTLQENTIQGLNFDRTAPSQYLELPMEDGSRRFLISPPLSPPPEWDHWERVEEGPNKKSVFSPQELSHLLWERLGGLTSNTVRKYQDEEISQDNEETNEVDILNQPEILFQDIDNGVPAIILDTIDNSVKIKRDTNSAPLVKTAMPPI